MSQRYDAGSCISAVSRKDFLLMINSFQRTGLHLLKWPVIVTCFLVFSAVGTLTASASPSGGSPYYIQTRCLATTAGAYSPSANVVDGFAETLNNCPATVSGRMYMAISENCSGVGASGNTSLGL